MPRFSMNREIRRATGVNDLFRPSRPRRSPVLQHLASSLRGDPSPNSLLIIYRMFESHGAGFEHPPMPLFHPLLSQAPPCLPLLEDLGKFELHRMPKRPVSQPSKKPAFDPAFRATHLCAPSEIRGSSEPRDFLRAIPCPPSRHGAPLIAFHP